MDDGYVEHILVERGARGDIAQVFAIPTVADEHRPGDERLTIDDHAQSVTAAKLLPRGKEVRDPLRPVAFLFVALALTVLQARAAPG